MSYPPSWKFDLDVPKDTPDAPDDEFDATTLDGKWTATSGSSGTVDLTRTSGTVYDLTSRPGWLLMQVDTSGAIRLRQDYTLGDGESVVAKIAYTLTVDGTPGIGNNEYNIGIGLSNHDTWGSGDNTKLILDVDSNAWRLAVLSLAGDRATPSSPGGAPMGSSVYFRYLRDGLDYYAMWSWDGAAWFQFAKQTFASALDNIWLICEANATIPDPVCIHAVDYVRLGESGLDPW